jgi:Tfp pilus assembly protein PilZ
MIIEGKSYDIAIGTDDGRFVANVTITVPWKPYTYITTNETPFITIIAPPIEEHAFFVINASKDGYLPAERTITVMKGALSIRTDRSTVVEEKEFQVTIKDQDSHPVEGAVVFIDPNGTHVSTDSMGIAYIDAPEVNQNRNITIKVIKSGYLDSSTSILVQDTGGSILNMGDNILVEIAPILFAAVAVIFAIFYVRWRRKTQKDIQPRKTEPTNHHGESLESTVNLRKKQREKEPISHQVKERGDVTFSSSDPRVEEIRIPLQEKRKETTFLSTEEHPTPSVTNQGNKEDEWFKGQEYMRYKLDEMTGKIDQKNEGKWFEGERNIESKVDEALKKQPRKKKDNQNDIK